MNYPVFINSRRAVRFIFFNTGNETRYKALFSQGIPEDFSDQLKADFQAYHLYLYLLPIEKGAALAPFSN